MKIRLTHPLITCICIANGNPKDLVRTIICYYSQNYPNKELIISYLESDNTSKHVIDTLKDKLDLRLIPLIRKQETSNGTAKNDAILQSNGEYICIWDDGNWYNYMRLMEQHNTILSKARFCDASVLTSITLYDPVNHIAAESDYLWGDTLLCKKSLLLMHPFSDKNTAIDLAIMQFLSKRGSLLYIDKLAFTFILLNNPSGSFNEQEFKYLFKRGRVVTQEKTDLIPGLLKIQ